MMRNIQGRHVQMRRFFVRLRPLEDELLSCWLVRTAHGHQTDASTFLNLHFPDRKNTLWKRDIDVLADEELLKILSMKSGLSCEELYSLTLRSYAGYLSEFITDKARNLFMLPLGNVTLAREKYGLRFCPQCLKDDKVPFFRKKWRLSFSTACTKHYCFLIDRCTKCDVPVTICKRLYDHGLPHCYNCGFFFSQSEPEYIDKESYGIKAITRLYDVLDSGLFKHNTGYMYSFHFFLIIAKLIKLACQLGPPKGFLDHEILRCQMPSCENSSINSKFHDQLPLKLQYLLFSGILNLLEDFPNKLKEFFRNNDLGKTRLSADMSYVPYSYSEVVNTFNRVAYLVSIEEVSNAIKCLQKSGTNPTKKRVSEMLGVGIAVHNSTPKRSEELRRSFSGK